VDPVAHTLVGAALAETGLRKKSPLATATLVLGANAPDIDFFVSILGRDAALLFRRGHTHGVVAMIVLPFALAALMLAWDRFVRRRRRPDAPPARAGPLVALAFLSVWSHPALDWLNTYGVRLLMPFDGTWFYGDSIFILDPWMWLLAAAPVVLARSNGKPSAAAWIVLGCATTALVTLVDLVPWGAKIAWIVGLAAIVALRVSNRARERVPAVAMTGVATLVVYIGAMLAGSHAARSDVDSWLSEQGIHADELAAGPAPADPFVREVIARAGGTYYFVERRWLGEPAFRFTHRPIPVGPRDEIVEAALASPDVRGLRTWMRFPAFEVEETPEGYTVHIEDVRYSRRESGGLGVAVVHLDRELRPRPPAE
jgi:inner membrane protein